MTAEKIAKRIFQNIPGGRRPKEIERKKWLEEDYCPWIQTSGRGQKGREGNVVML